MKKMLLLSLATLFSAVPAFADTGYGAAVGNAGLYALAAAFVMGIAAWGGTTAQSRIGAAAMEGIARNPQAQPNMFVSMILGLALIESLVILSFVIAIQIVGKF